MKRCLLILFVYISLFIISITYSYADLVTVKVDGVSGKIKANILAFLEISHQKDSISKERIRALFSKSISQIKEALKPFGYFRPKIESSLKLLDKKRRIWQAYFYINKGERLRISSITFKIVGQGKGEKYFKIKPPFKPGEYFDQNKYEGFKKSLLDLAYANGYLDAKFLKKKVLVYLKKNSAQIILIFDTGDRYYFGALSFKGGHFSKDFLIRFAEFRKGDPFSRKKLLNFRKRLLDSNYFESIDFNLASKKTSHLKEIPIDVRIKAKKPNVFRLGIGYVSDVGVRFSMSWNRRYIGRYGHHLKARLKISPEESKLTGEYFIPLDRPYSDYLSLKPTIHHYDTDSRLGWKYAVYFLYSKALKNGWRRSAGINFGYEDYEVGADNENAKEIVPFLSFEKKVADNFLYTNRGYLLQFNFSGEIGGFLAKESYLSSTFKGKYINRISKDYRLLTRLNLGVILTEKVRELPASVRFYAGGYSSIRGFSLEELGPTDPYDGETTGGRYLLVASLELERHIYKSISGALFLDFGNSFDPEYKNRIEVGTGFGIRIRSPLGPIRLDFGFGISKNPVPFKFYLSFGPEF